MRATIETKQCRPNEMAWRIADWTRLFQPLGIGSLGIVGLHQDSRDRSDEAIITEREAGDYVSACGYQVSLDYCTTKPSESVQGFEARIRIDQWRGTQATDGRCPQKIRKQRSGMEVSDQCNESLGGSNGKCLRHEAWERGRDVESRSKPFVGTLRVGSPLGKVWPAAGSESCVGSGNRHCEA